MVSAGKLAAQEAVVRKKKANPSPLQGCHFMTEKWHEVTPEAARTATLPTTELCSPAPSFVAPLVPNSAFGHDFIPQDPIAGLFASSCVTKHSLRLEIKYSFRNSYHLKWSGLARTNHVARVSSVHHPSSMCRLSCKKTTESSVNIV